MTSSQAFILSDQLAGLSAIDFSFCFKQDGSSIASAIQNNLDTDVIDLTPFLCFKSKHMKQLLKDQNNDEENKQPLPILAAVNELKLLSPPERETISLDKYKLELEHVKYFEERVRQRDHELQQLKIRYETLKNERDNEVMLMENIILELQLELRAARDEAEFKRKKSQQPTSSTPPKSLFNFANRKTNSPTTPTNDHTHHDDDDEDTQMRPIEGLLVTDPSESVNRKSNSRRSSHSTTTTNTEDDQYELVRQITANNNNQLSRDIKPTSSPEMVSSATSLSSPSLSDDDELHEKTSKPIIHESGRFEPVEMTAEQANLLQEASATD